MEPNIRLILQALCFSSLTAAGCLLFFDTILDRRKMRRPVLSHLLPAAFALGFLIIAITPIPPYVLQPVRVVFVLFLAVQINYDVKIPQNLFLSILYCLLLWLTSLFPASVLFLLPQARLSFFAEQLLDTFLLLLLSGVFHYKYKNRIRLSAASGWMKFAPLPLLSLILAMTITGLPFGKDNITNIILIAGIFTVLDLFTFYLMVKLFEKETEMHQLKLRQERTDHQVHSYQNMRQSYQKQQQFLHDYKNQLNCILGLLADGQTAEALSYVEKLNGTVHKAMDVIDTGHPVVNVLLNQKYHAAKEHDITMSIVVNNMSALNIGTEDLVVLLVNLLDNAIEACEKLSGNRIIKFKMVLEADQLFLSVCNPVSSPVLIQANTVVSTKKDPQNHGIGLINVKAVVDRLRGTEVLKCENGWFLFSAMIPNPS